MPEESSSISVSSSSISSPASSSASGVSSSVVASVPYVVEVPAPIDYSVAFACLIILLGMVVGVFLSDLFTRGWGNGR